MKRVVPVGQPSFAVPGWLRTRGWRRARSALGRSRRTSGEPAPRRDPLPAIAFVPTVSLTSTEIDAVPPGAHDQQRITGPQGSPGEVPLSHGEVQPLANPLDEIITGLRRQVDGVVRLPEAGRHRLPPRCPRKRTWNRPPAGPRLAGGRPHVSRRKSARWLGGVRSQCRGSGLIGVPARPAPKRVE